MLSDDLYRELENLYDLRQKLLPGVALLLVRMHNAGDLNLYEIRTADQLDSVIDCLGVDESNAFEVLVMEQERKLQSAHMCLSGDDPDPESALIICSSFIETEINSTIRQVMRLRNFSHGSITDAMKGTDLRTKIDVLLPLLDVQLTERQRQIVLEQNKVRNQILHYKGIPERHCRDEIQEGDFHIVRKESNKFFSSHPIDMISKCFLDFMSTSVFSQQHVVKALQLLDLIEE